MAAVVRDFVSECVKDFQDLAGYAAKMPRRGYDSEAAYQAKVREIDEVLDLYLDWRAIQALEA